MVRKKKSRSAGSRKAGKRAKKTSKKRKVRAKKAKGPKPIGRVTHWFGKINVAVIKLLAPFKVGDYIHIKGAHADFVQHIDSMQINHKFVEKARKGVEIGLRLKQKVREGYQVFKGARPNQKASFTPILSQPLVKRGLGSQSKPTKTLRPNPPPPPQKKGGYGDVKFFKF